MRREYVDITHLLTSLPGRAEFTAMGGQNRRLPGDGVSIAAKRADPFARNHHRLAVDRGPSRHGARNPTRTSGLGFNQAHGLSGFVPVFHGLLHWRAKSAKMAVTTVNRHDDVEHKACPQHPWLPRVRRSGIESPQAPVAQLDRALPSEGKGRVFESRRARQ
jgi:hypothetical protein